MTKECNHNVKQQINVPMDQSLFDLVEEARWSLRITRAELGRRAMADYVANIARKAELLPV